MRFQCIAGNLNLRFAANHLEKFRFAKTRVRRSQSSADFRLGIVRGLRVSVWARLLFLYRLGQDMLVKEMTVRPHQNRAPLRGSL